MSRASLNNYTKTIRLTGTKATCKTLEYSLKKLLKLVNFDSKTRKQTCWLIVKKSMGFLTSRQFCAPTIFSQ